MKNTNMLLITLVLSLCLFVNGMKQGGEDVQYYYWAFNLEDAPLQDISHIVCGYFNYYKQAS